MRTLAVAAAAVLAVAALAAYGAERPDAYVLALAWSPTYCAKNPGNTWQCAPRRRFGFVVHGLWPEYDRGGARECERHPRLNGAGGSLGLYGPWAASSGLWP